MVNTKPPLSVQVVNLTKKFGSFTAVDRLSFEVEKGEIYGFLGPNGAGKSTTIRMLSGLLTPTSGTGIVAGLDIAREPEKVKETIGYMSQKFSLYRDLTVEENIDFYMGIYKVPPLIREKRKDWAIEMAGLKHHRNERTETLSGGWKQRLSLGCSILHNPSLLFLDEPTAGVDPINRRHFWNLIYDLADNGMTVFVTTHYMDEAEYVDYIAFIYRGRLIIKGPPEEVKKQSITGSIFDVETDHPQLICDAAKRLPIVREASLFGSGAHIYLNEGCSDKDRLIHELERGGVGFSLRQIDPTMEDVFISLIEKTDREEVHKR
ncbi:ABC transporter ATP-binding protein [Estrella lausannensis]|uniref:ABC transporter ATP-binding protein n=1 Tax=Estrella lausannensis TaxID=483423 RepID=A0A0H5DQE3_9BACT|nr:ABC transporter ATP-binding protein [Estrella lausannensis]CRX38866.1 ABC transporter ATP-binding protein [Estrella lausannensis]